MALGHLEFEWQCALVCSIVKFFYEKTSFHALTGGGESGDVYLKRSVSGMVCVELTRLVKMEKIEIFSPGNKGDGSNIHPRKS